MNIAMTTLSSKILSQDKEYFAELAVDAVLRLKVSIILLNFYYLICRMMLSHVVTMTHRIFIDMCVHYDRVAPTWKPFKFLRNLEDLLRTPFWMKGMFITKSCCYFVLFYMFNPFQCPLLSSF